MLKYPSSAVEQTRESIYSSKNHLETILLLTCLVKNGMREDKKNSLISEGISNSYLTEEEIVSLYQLLNIKSIFGYRMNSDQKRLGKEPNGQYRHEEYLIGKTLETLLNVRLYRSSSPMYDFVLGKENWELVGPVAPFYFDSDSFNKSLNKHLDNKIGMSTLVVCTVTLSQEEQGEISKLLEEDSRCKGINLLILDNETLLLSQMDNYGYGFLC
jgi:hypothetical protein